MAWLCLRRAPSRCTFIEHVMAPDTKVALPTWCDLTQYR